MPATRLRTAVVRALAGTTAATALAAGLSACGSDGASSASDAVSAGNAATGTVTVGALSNGAARKTDLAVSEVAKIRAELPPRVLKSGQLVVGIGALPAGSAPLAFVGDDQRTLTGSEPDISRLVAAVLGLKPVLRNSTWENLFVGIDSGRTDVGFSNITDTEERKRKYDFASYREDNLAFAVLKSSTWNFAGDFENLAGRTVAVGAGTNQEKILLEWRSKLRKEGKDVTVKYFPDNNGAYLALTGRKIDAYFAPNPDVAYHAAKDASTPAPTRTAGTFSGAGTTVQGLIAATSKKDSGLAKPLADALNYLIANGQYAKWLAAWNLSDEAVPTSLVDPPGLPLTNS
ncbi:transporter substrate-binding domain-containing protein [Streptomyces sp. V4-01]|uniref:Transporter substrate-binding domain-containing protein n=1 Tax=Actinacidiphila polyblastidii TaxID=3110430 RepID=A0ABU7P421_9ACTN|nr:transporter substrate-binding domain-containing protein [Streptomyces sp. V4-01]